MSSTTDELVPRAELIQMEDERDAALLDLERLTRLLAERHDQLGDVRLDAEGHRRDVAALEQAATSLIDQREKLLNERNAARETIARLRDLTARGNFVEDPGSTHFDTCYHHHAACLAHQVRRILGRVEDHVTAAAVTSTEAERNLRLGFEQAHLTAVREATSAADVIARVRAICLEADAACDAATPKSYDATGNGYVYTRYILAALGGAEGEPSSSTITHGPDRGRFAWGPKGWR